MIRGKMSELGSKQLRDLGIKQSNLNIILKALGGGEVLVGLKRVVS